MGCDVNPAVFARWEKEYSLQKFTTDPEELIHDPELDVIDICSPNNFHAPRKIAALEAGKHGMCKKTAGAHGG